MKLGDSAIEAVEVMSVKLTDIEHNRMASVWQVYGKVPCEAGMQLTIDADNDVFERRDSAGNLKAGMSACPTVMPSASASASKPTS